MRNELSPQTLADRRHALPPTAPQTSAGKTNSSLTALKTGPTGRTVLLPSDDAAAYERHVQRFVAEFAPCGDREAELVLSLANTQWRLSRIPALEAGIYAVAHLEMADLFPEETPAARAALIQAKAFLTYNRQLNDLQLQESRLRRQFENDLASLRKVQFDRIVDAALGEAEQRRNEAQARKMASNFRVRKTKSNRPGSCSSKPATGADTQAGEEQVAADSPAESGRKTASDT